MAAATLVLVLCHSTWLQPAGPSAARGTGAAQHMHTGACACALQGCWCWHAPKAELHCAPTRQCQQHPSTDCQPPPRRATKQCLACKAGVRTGCQGKHWSELPWGHPDGPLCHTLHTSTVSHPWAAVADQTTPAQPGSGGSMYFLSKPTSPASPSMGVCHTLV
jgi:hypothetical protein